MVTVMGMRPGANTYLDRSMDICMGMGMDTNMRMCGVGIDVSECWWWLMYGHAYGDAYGFAYEYANEIGCG